GRPLPAVRAGPRVPDRQGDGGGRGLAGPVALVVWVVPGPSGVRALVGVGALAAGRVPVSGRVAGLQEGAQALVQVDLLAPDQAGPLQPAPGNVQLRGGRQVLGVGPDPVEAVDVGGAQDLPAEALAPGRGRPVGVS